MSEEIKPITRYDDWSGRGVRRHEKGAYVAFSDYEKRCAEVAALKKELEIARGERNAAYLRGRQEAIDIFKAQRTAP